MRYLRLMLKRILRLAPAVLGITLLTLAVLGGVAWQVFSRQQTEAAQQKKIGVVGSLEDSYLRAALFALEQMDHSSVYVDLIPMELSQAQGAVEKGEILGYLFVPEDFVEGILERRSVPLRFVTKGGPSSVGALLLLEACDVASELTEGSQKGIYGMQSYARAEGMVDAELWERVDELTLRYADSILGRSGVAKLIPTAGPDGASLLEYLVCAVLTLTALLWGISCYGILRRRDLSLEKMLVAKYGRAPLYPLAEYLSFFLFSLLFFFLLVVAVCRFLPEELGSAEPLVLFAAFVPGLGALTAMEFALYQLFPKGAGALPGLFFSVLGLGFVSGCLYPLWFLPPAVQKLSLFLPTGGAMALLRQSFSYRGEPLGLAVCLGWWGLFLAVAVAVRWHKLRR